ncbi:nuclear transport factor 2 family protein [Kordiimonas sp. SCSIO 12603]|uniref:nuclear transport factor 2 family protein n=1 Tax=Kordiimonas sp. SCSIO 12603 TaxID=2829596 RepID=UPI00210583D5|nr:nuclear transport factor 2 family protein [Kordiimonas sp. SCSIO 12603]UTW58994.1 nuclear transport factor 2 family protein [Kordiimonas sp. SCSIO 12603]
MTILSSIKGACILLAATAISFPGIATDEEDIRKTLNHYIDGTSFSRPAEINQAFHETANLYLTKKDEPHWIVPSSEYAGWFGRRTPGTDTGRIGEIISMDIAGDTATAKVEILVPGRKMRYVDQFLVKKLDGEWKIIAKTASSAPANNHGGRVLFILSSQAFHGSSDLPAGASFSEIVNAYDEFKKHGYTVDFVTPEGGSLPLSYINTSIDMHRKYIYDSDLMYALAHTKKPEDIKPARYKAVHYVGGSNAMYGVADNKALQDISMEIYEKHGGIISSVCHGTAGIVNLKTSSGTYLVAGKKVVGYPEDYERQTAEYFKQFPLLIGQSVQDHDGDFRFGPRNQAFVEVDGRLITGQNHLSSRLVVQKIVEALDK